MFEEWYDANQRELDYEDHRFQYNNDIDGLMDVLGSIFTPDLVDDFFTGCQSIQECVARARDLNFKDEEDFKNSFQVALSCRNVFD